MNDNKSTAFQQQYGPWALVAGGAQGIGEAYTRYLAARGLNVIVLDISAQALADISGQVSSEFGVECLAVEVDLSSHTMLETIAAAVGDREVGLMIYNAGLADVGPFYKQDTGLDFELKKIAINVTGPLQLTYHFGKGMLARQRGGILLMSSGAGLQGSPYYAHYSATKAYDIALAEALWGEFAPYNVDVLAVAAGMTLSTAAEGFEHIKDRSQFQTTTELVDEAMAALGQGKPTLIAGKNHRANAEQMLQIPKEELIRYMADHAINNFLGGTIPRQNID
ncbi:SDR family NAD(P)-dependent oxidoreductase [Parahaliea aestuarii]|uniref:SDR family NAD(P)-dependent oxidoreductase n=1 Tax=Parahaliea aestuarii TaxID=1852021 RepID=A0A5C9A100_9GAMM|nr:SDR family NAD(P)-dependent oxidoreductase [Parahaliea aestuarii]TXS93091.1 SDR family NAD(P)-dependent oxidoreductase [Parahaliea aestuarii]